MKRLLTCMLVFFVLLSAVSVSAQDGFTAFGLDPVTPLAAIGPVVGKTVSVYSDQSNYTVPYSPTTLMSTPVPSKYKSKTQWLIAQVSLAGDCTGGDLIGYNISVDGVPMNPGTSVGNYYHVCRDNGGFEAHHLTWYLHPESLGGPAITPGATVLVRVVSSLGTARIGLRSLLVQAVK